MSIIPQLIVNSIIAGSLYALLALGFNLSYSATKFFNLAHGVMATIGGYATFYFSRHLGFNIYLSAVLGIFISGLFGFILDKSVYLQMRKKKASNMILLVASLGAFTAIQAVVAILFSSQFQTLSMVFENQQIFTLFGATITSVQLAVFILSILATVILGLILKFTKFGNATLAISDDEEVARIVGIDTNKIIGYVFFISSSLAGLAGILVGMDTGIQPTMGMNLLLKGVIASIIGGVGNPWAGAVGAFILGFVENFGIWKINGQWKDAIAFSVLIIFLLFKPNGLFKK